MSQENVEIVRRGYEGFNRGDQDAMVADVAPTFEYVGTGAVAGFPGNFQGAEGWVEAVSWLRDEFVDARVEIRELVEGEDKVLARLTLHGRGKRSGADVTWDMWHLWTFRDRKVVRGQGFMSREEAFKAAELPG